MQRTYPKRYAKLEISRYAGLIAEQLGLAEGYVTPAGEMDPGDAELILVDDASAFSLAMTDDPRYTCPLLNLRADVLYVDEEFGAVRFNGPVGGRRRGRSSKQLDKVVPLPALLWRAGVEPGVWVAVSGYRAEDFSITLVRVTEELLERGHVLSSAPRSRSNQTA